MKKQTKLSSFVCLILVANTLMTNVTAAPSDETGAKTLTEKQAVEAMKNSAPALLKM